MKEYTSFKYIYPPRPETKAPPTGLATYERMGFLAQAKMNGSCAVLFLDGRSARMMGRHNNTFTREILDKEELKRLHRGAGWFVVVGEYMNKSQRDSLGKPFTGFVIFDVLVHNGRHLLGSTFKQRQELLDTLYPTTEDYDTFLERISPTCYRAKCLSSNLQAAWNLAIKTEMYEGFVLKKPTGILENGFREANNMGWQVKIRKPTRNYSY